MDLDGYTGRSAIRVAEVLRSAKLAPSGWWIAHCPFCVERMGTPARKASLGINDESSVWHCFRCGAKGALRKDDARELKERARAKEPKGAKENPHEPPDGFWSLAEEPGSSATSLEPAREYLRSRGISDRVIREANIGACATGKYAGRIVVPVLPAPGEAPPERGPWLGFVARTWGPKSAVFAPYLYPSNMPKGEALYNAGVLDEVTELPVMVVEGVFDTFPVWPDAVALLGEHSESQVRALAKAERPVAVVLDGDAWRKGVGLARRLRLDGQRAGAVILPPTKDPDEMPLHDLREALWECIERGEVRM